MQFCEIAGVNRAHSVCNAITQAHDGQHPVGGQINRMRETLKWTEDAFLRRFLSELIPTMMTETIQRIVIPAIQEQVQRESLFLRVFRQTTT